MSSTTPAPVALTLTTAQADLLRQALEMLHNFNGGVIHHATVAEDPAGAEEAREERRQVDTLLGLLDAAVDTAEGRDPNRKPVEGVALSRFAGLA